MPAFAQTLSYTGTPALGQTLSFRTTGTPGGGYAIAASTVPGPSALPPLGTLAIGQPFWFLVGPTLELPFFPALGPNGQAIDSIQIPLNLALFGMSFHFQAVYSDPASPLGLALTNGLSFTIGSPVNAPTIATLSPAAGGASGGTLVTITGTHFLPGPTTASIGGQPLSNLQVVDAQTITGRTPVGFPNTSSDLVVNAAGGAAALAGAFQYLPEIPSILSITPDHAHAGGGTLVTITGSGLGPGTVIYLGGFVLNPLTQTAAQVQAFAPNIGQVGYADAWVASMQGNTYYPNAFRYTIPLDTGTGADGAFAPTSNTTLNTANNQGVFHFTTVNIPAGVTVTGMGPYPLTIRCQGEVSVAGTVEVSGHSGAAAATPSVGGPGGFQGGNNAQPGSGPGAGIPGGLGGWCGGYGGSYGTTMIVAGNPPVQCTINLYGNSEIQPLIGGSGGASYSGPAGGGGGAIALIVGGDVHVTGMIRAVGGDGAAQAGAGSGGAVRIQSQGSIALSGVISVAGGSSPGNSIQFQGGNGRWYIQNWLGQSSYGTSALVPIGLY